MFVSMSNTTTSETQTERIVPAQIFLPVKIHAKARAIAFAAQMPFKEWLLQQIKIAVKNSK